MEIQQVVVNDIEQLKRIARGAVSAAVPIGEDERAKLLLSIEQDVEKFVDHDDRVYLKVGDTAPAGYILVKEHWNLAHLFISPEHQGQNLGKKLLLSAMSICKASNRKGFIRVNSSLNAVGFYKKFGFVTYEPENPVPSFAEPLIYRF